MSQSPKIRAGAAKQPASEGAGAADAVIEPIGSGISHRLTFLLYRAVATLVDATAPYYRSFGLSIPAARAMVSLAENCGELTVSRLSHITGIDLSTISHLLRRLERLDYVSRARDGSDNRVVVVKLTPAGAEIADRCRDASLRHEALLLHGITEDDAALLKETLSLVNTNCALISRLDKSC